MQSHTILARCSFVNSKGGWTEVSQAVLGFTITVTTFMVVKSRRSGQANCIKCINDGRKKRRKRKNFLPVYRYAKFLRLARDGSSASELYRQNVLFWFSKSRTSVWYFFGGDDHDQDRIHGVVGKSSFDRQKQSATHLTVNSSYPGWSLFTNSHLSVLDLGHNYLLSTRKLLVCYVIGSMT